MLSTSSCTPLHCFALQGIIHRDLKANNIFCSAHGIVKLGDFGISKALGDNQNVARTMVGTPYYMSPEILKVCHAFTFTVYVCSPWGQLGANSLIEKYTALYLCTCFPFFFVW